MSFQKTALVAALALLVACGGPSTDAPAEQAASPKKSAGSADAPVACDLMDENRVASLFDVPADSVKLNKFGSDTRSCGYSWRKADADAIDEANKERILNLTKARMEAAAKGEDPPQLDLLRAEATLAYNFVVRESAENAERSFKANIERLKKGVEAEAQGQKVSFRINYDQVVDGVGNQAAWSSEKRQLAFQQGRYLVYVNVAAAEDPADDLAFARKVAAVLMPAF